MKKRFLAMLLSVAMVLTMLPVTAFAAIGEADTLSNVTATYLADDNGDDIVTINVPDMDSKTDTGKLYYKLCENTSETLPTTSAPITVGTGQYIELTEDPIEKGNNTHVIVVYAKTAPDDTNKQTTPNAVVSAHVEIQESAPHLTGVTAKVKELALEEESGVVTFAANPALANTNKLVVKKLTTDEVDAEARPLKGDTSAYTEYDGTTKAKVGDKFAVAEVVSASSEVQAWDIITVALDEANVDATATELTVTRSADNAITLTKKDNSELTDFKAKVEATPITKDTAKASDASDNATTSVTVTFPVKGQVVNVVKKDADANTVSWGTEAIPAWVKATIKSGASHLTTTGFPKSMLYAANTAIEVTAQEGYEPVIVEKDTDTLVEGFEFVAGDSNTYTLTLKDADVANGDLDLYIGEQAAPVANPGIVISTDDPATTPNTVLKAADEFESTSDTQKDAAIEVEADVKTVYITLSGTAADATPTVTGTDAAIANDKKTVTLASTGDTTITVPVSSVNYIITITKKAAGFVELNVTKSADGKVAVTAKTEGATVPSGLQYVVLTENPNWSSTTTSKTITEAIADVDSALKGTISATTPVPAAGNAVQYLVVYKVGAADDATLEAYGVLTIPAAEERKISVKAGTTELIEFDAGVTEYSVIVGKDVESITVTAEPETATISGATAGAVAKNPGNISTVTVAFGADEYTISLVWPKDDDELDAEEDVKVPVTAADVDTTTTEGTATLDLDAKTDEVLQTISNTKAVNDNATANDPDAETVPVTIPATTDETVTKTEVTLPTAVSDALISSEVPVQIETNAGTVTLPSAAIEKVQGDVLTVVVEDTTPANVADTDVVRAKFAVTVMKGDEAATEAEISGLEGASMITLSFPVANADIEGVVEPVLAWLKSVGEYKPLTNPSSRPGATGFTIFTAKTSHLSDFVVVGKAALEPEVEEISIAVKSGTETLTMTPAFTAEETEYTVTTDKTSATIEVTNVDTSKVTIDGKPYTEAGATTIDLTNLPAAGKEVKVVYTATTDGEPVTYTITFKKATTVSEPLNIKLLDADGKEITFTPDFAVGTGRYDVSTSAESIKIVVSGDPTKLANTVVRISGETPATDHPLDANNAYTFKWSDFGFDDSAFVTVVYDKGTGHTNGTYQFNFKKTAVVDPDVNEDDPTGIIVDGKEDETVKFETDPTDSNKRTAEVKIESGSSVSFTVAAGTTVTLKNAAGGTIGIYTADTDGKVTIPTVQSGNTAEFTIGTTKYVMSFTADGTTPDPTGNYTVEWKSIKFAGTPDFKQVAIKGTDGTKAYLVEVTDPNYNTTLGNLHYFMIFQGNDSDVKFYLPNTATRVRVYEADAADMIDASESNFKYPQNVEPFDKDLTK